MMKLGFNVCLIAMLASVQAADCEIEKKTGKMKKGVITHKLNYATDVNKDSAGVSHQYVNFEQFFKLVPKVANGCDTIKNSFKTTGTGFNFEVLHDGDCATMDTTDGEYMTKVLASPSNTKSVTMKNGKDKTIKWDYWLAKTDEKDGWERKFCAKLRFSSQAAASDVIIKNAMIMQRSADKTKAYRDTVDLQNGNQFKVKESATGFNCGMKGYKTLVLEVVDLLIFGIALGKEVFMAILPEDLAMALDHLYLGLTGAGAWIGFVMAAAYYMAEDQGYGDMMCEGSGYAWAAIDTFHYMVDFEKDEKRKKEKEQTDGLMVQFNDEDSIDD